MIDSLGRSRYRLRTSVKLSLPPDQVFAFFADAGNLQKLTPSRLHFEIVTPMPISMQVGTIIDYRIRYWGMPLRWRSRISGWDPPFAFEDTQERGPYTRWVHTHRFRPDGDGTLAEDEVDYIVPGGPLGPLMHAGWIRRDLEQSFQFRGRRMRSVTVCSPTRLSL